MRKAFMNFVKSTSMKISVLLEQENEKCFRCRKDKLCMPWQWRYSFALAYLPEKSR